MKQAFHNVPHIYARDNTDSHFFNMIGLHFLEMYAFQQRACKTLTHAQAHTRTVILSLTENVKIAFNRPV